MLVYIDSSALVKRVIHESSSPALLERMAAAHGDGDHFVSSSLAAVEVSRALRSRLDAEPPRRIAQATEIALSGVGEAPLSADVTNLARRIGPPVLRTLDALHLATAVLLDVDEVWTYDDRMLAAADGMGLTTRAPQ